jgi:hypothetical protein
MTSYLENIMISLNSANGDLMNSTKKSDVRFPFTGLLKEEPDLIRSFISIINAQIPVSFYTINETNCYFQIQYLPSGILEDIFIPFGNYNATSLITTIQALWLATPTGVGNPLTLSISQTTGKLTFSFATANIVIFVPTYRYNSTSLLNYTHQILGFFVNVQYTGASITAPYPLNLLGTKRLSIKSSKLSVNNFSSRINGYTDTITTIPSDQPPYNMISFVSTVDTQKNVLREITIDEIDLQITDENNNYIDFNNTDWTMTLIMTKERLNKPKDIIKLNDITNKLNFEFENVQNSTANTDNDITPLTQDEKDLQLLES